MQPIRYREQRLAGDRLARRAHYGMHRSAEQLHVDRLRERRCDLPRSLHGSRLAIVFGDWDQCRGSRRSCIGNHQLAVDPLACAGLLWPISELSVHQRRLGRRPHRLRRIQRRSRIRMERRMGSATDGALERDLGSRRQYFGGRVQRTADIASRVPARPTSTSQP